MRLATLLLFATIFVGCGTSHRLNEYDFRGATVAVVAAVPPAPFVTAGFDEAWVSLDQPVRSAVRVGTYLAKRREVKQARGRLDSALALVDVPDLVARQLTGSSARLLGYQPVDDPRRADFVLDVQIQDYGIVADSWGAQTFFVVEGDVRLIETERRRTVWKERLDDRVIVDESFFAGSATLGNILTARTLNDLSVEDIEDGLNALAEFTASRVHAELREDFYDR
ncbi:MAG: hypothetical protein AAF752_00305 [Bacteroidota bacterium]